MKKSLFVFALFAFAMTGFQACGDAPKDPTVTEAPPADPAPAADPAQAAVEQMAAFYIGKLPCPDCDGIQTTLTLNADPQKSYSLEEIHEGKQPKTVISDGTWSMEGNTVTLNGKTGAAKYQIVGEGLVALNDDGSLKDASKYLLKRVQGE